MTPEAIQIVFTPDTILIALAVVLIAVLAYLVSVMSRIAAGVEKIAAQGGVAQAPAHGTAVAQQSAALAAPNNNEIALAIAAAVKRASQQASP